MIFFKNWEMVALASVSSGWGSCTGKIDLAAPVRVCSWAPPPGKADR